MRWARAWHKDISTSRNKLTTPHDKWR